MAYTLHTHIPIEQHRALWLKRWLIASALCSAAVSQPALAKEVTQTYNGLSINANLEQAPGRTLGDGVILITHGGLAHHGMELIRTMQTLLKTRGYTSLAINLSLGLDNRHGMYDCSVTHRHLNDDAAAEIGFWTNWLEQQGAKDVVLLGHSRGGAQTALYVAEHNDKRIKAVVLMAPAILENTSPADYQRRHNKPLAPQLDNARKLIKAGKGDAILNHVGLLNCSDTSATARSFVSYYGRGSRLDTPALLPKVKKPVLVIVAESDEVVTNLDKKIAPLVNKTRLQMKIIPVADHTFRDLAADDSADAIDSFLQALATQ